ncbi:DUF3987 domain-containing protein [Legionella septentrionalis]|uniref:DUF3987 domain-containing protein n=1 Tax=Legionella septentrionalis TaxID=2498109 RepID=UPI000F8C8856|nr:DUF3987 domain-containing protein [Legionella septentrionalis]RUR08561.1 DUF3987 domain-containing protein [Legionella septentrionalis]
MLPDSNKIEEALTFISSDDRQTWVRIGMAIKSAFGDAGFDIWDNWSKKSDAYNTKDAINTWKSFNVDGGVTIGTLYHIARSNGWFDDKSNYLTIHQLARSVDTSYEKELSKQKVETALRAKRIIEQSTKACSQHPYLLKKEIAPVSTIYEIAADRASEILGYIPKSKGQALIGNLLVIPIENEQGLASLELIDGKGLKTALAGKGTKREGYWLAQPLPLGSGRDLTIVIGEGVSTVLSVQKATGLTVLAALSAGNLKSVCQKMRSTYPEAKLLILADLLKENGKPNPQAIEAAKSINGILAAPHFGAHRDSKSTDFNDMARLFGLDEVKKIIENVISLDINRNHKNNENEWPQPQPLLVNLEPEPYPIDALPKIIRSAVGEVQNFTKAPISLVAASALSAISLASQALYDVKRAEKLTGPLSLYFLTIADSGERKSTCDGFFNKAIRDYEEKQAELAKPAIKNYQTAFEAWEAKRNGIKEKIRQLAKQNKSTDFMVAQLHSLDNGKPKPLQVPRLIYVDATPEALAYSLSKNWPSGGVVSAEAGIVFGAHGMGKDSVMRNLSLLNILWDGGKLSIERRSVESFVVRGVRLTLGFQVQEATLNDFFNRSGNLARGTGFLARFLVSLPASTQGYRKFTEAPDNWPALENFNQRITELLEKDVPINEDGILVPSLLAMSVKAKEAWIIFHDAIEAELIKGGELYDVRDVASKIADNAVRLAALFHVFQGAVGDIGLEELESASRIVAWHLNESKRFFGELALPVEMGNVISLDSWLIEYCLRHKTMSVPRREVQRNITPVSLRHKSALDDALNELVEANRIKLNPIGRKEIHINPMLLDENGK